MRRLPPFSTSVSTAKTRGVLLAWLVMTGFGGAPSAGAQLDQQAPLTAAGWSASAYGHHAAGTVCWIFGEGGSLRVEVRQGEGAAADGPDLGPLFHQSGDGWTVILGEGESGTLNAWGRQWREVPVGLARVVRLIATCLEAYPDFRPDFPFAQSPGNNSRHRGIARPRMLAGPSRLDLEATEWRFQLEPLDLKGSAAEKAPDFRRRMTARGRGGGGAGEILVLTWLPGPDGLEPGVRVHSFRRPGTLVVTYPRLNLVDFPEPEVFLPLWPLSQFYESR